MKNSKLEFSVGLFVLLGLAAITYLTIKLGTGSLIGGDTYLIESRFANAGGIHQGCSVLLSGVTVGRVEGVRMDPADYSALSPGADEAFLKPGNRITMTESAVDLESLIGKMAFGSVDKGKEKQDKETNSVP